MKVTIIVGGRWHAFDLAKELYLKGYLYRLITNYPYFAIKKWGIPKEHVVSLPTTFFLVKAIYWLGGESLMMKCQWVIHSWFARQASKYLQGSQLIHAWSSWAEPSLEWSIRNAIPSILERSSAHILEQSSLLRSEYLRLGASWSHTHPKIEAMECREYQLASMISVPSTFVQDTFKSRGFKEPKVAKHLLGADLRKFVPKYPSTDNRIKKNALKILFVGSLTPQKGVHDLLNAFNKFHSNSSCLTLLGGGISTEIKQVINQNRDVRVICPGHQDQNKLIDYYHDHDLLVLPSIQDGFGMVLAQALCCGLPIIASVNTGGKDLLELDGLSPRTVRFAGIDCVEYSAGWIIPIRSPAVMTSLFEYIHVNQIVLSEKQDAARLLRNADLSWQSYASSLCSSYMSLLKCETK